MFIKSRRDFLQAGLSSVTALGALGGMSKFGEMNAFAAGGGSYQALVCIFLAGGNDGHNTVIPISTAAQGINLYQQARQNLALPQASLLQIQNGTDVYGLHPKLTELQQLYNGGKAAILTNVGMLVAPGLDRTSYLNGAAVPANLFSHSDQANQWQTTVPNGLISTGWGGRLADAVQAQNAGAIFPPVVDASGCGMFCTGNQNFPSVVPPTGAVQVSGIQGNTARQQGMQSLLSFDNGLKLVQSSNGIFTRGSNNANTLNGLLAAGPVINTVFPSNNGLAAQLKMVARIMSVRGQLGLNRQIFFCTLGGFDTHSSQLANQDALLAQLSPAIAAFYSATVELGVSQQVTTFTTSEFGRTLQPNSSSGTDHAWASHHFVIGGAVKGGTMYGNFPVLALGGQYDATGGGAMIPTTSVTQYAATLAKWFGVGAGSMQSIFPSIGNFPNSDLGFLG